MHISTRSELPSTLVTCTPGALVLTCQCNRCGHPAMLTLAYGADGYEVLEVRSHCKHVPEGLA